MCEIVKDVELWMRPILNMSDVELRPIAKILDSKMIVINFACVEDNITMKEADLFWIYFRLNNPESIKTGVSTTHLSLTNEQQEYMKITKVFDFYQTHIEPLFLKLISNPNGRIHFFNKSNDKFFCLLRNDDKFYRTKWLINEKEDLECSINENFAKYAKDSPYSLAILAIYYE